MKPATHDFKSTVTSSSTKKIFFTFLLLFAIFSSFSQQKISGKVTDVNNVPIPGASVLEKNTTNAASTDFDGNFEITTKGNNSTLIFSYLGLKTKEIKTDGRNSITLVLESETNELSEVVIIGYGTQKRGEVTSAVATVKAKDFTQGAVRDASELIVGKVAGLVISNGSGDPTAGPSVSLRGIASLEGGTSPLILINGIPGSFDSVSVNDIASIDVLKDASAAAIYGTRGANGVILITTKNVDRDVPNTLAYTGYTAVSSFAKKANFLDASQYRSLLADGVKMPFADEGYSTNWLDEITRTAINTNHNINMKGGTAKSNYIANINYGNQEGVFLGTFNKELRVSFDVNHAMFNNKLKFNLNVVRTTQDFGGFDTNVYRQALIRNPTARPQDDNGNWTQTSRFQYSNPVASINETQRLNEAENTRLSAGLTLTILPGLDTDLRLSNVKNTVFNGYYETKKHYSNTIQGRNGVASRTDSRTNLDLLEWTSKYVKTLDKHSFTVLGGYSYQYSMSENGFASNYNFPTDAFSFNNIGAGQALLDGKASMGSYKEDNKLIGFFGRGTYSFDNKYHLLASVRREGSSKFGYNYQWGTFSSVSAGWTISNESFLKDVSFVNNIKLRAGFGETGIIPNNPYESLTRLNYEGYVYDNGKWIQGLVPNSNPNPDLRWEKSQEINLGLDFGFFKNRISGSIDVYNKKTKDMLWYYNVPMPPNLHDTTLANVGKMENKGFEILLNLIPVQTKDFEWDSNITFSHNENKLTSLSNDLYEIEGNFINTGNAGDPISFTTHRLEVGQPIGNFWGLKSVDITDDGKWIIETKDGTRKTLTTDLYTDANKQYLGNGIPKFNGGWTNTFRYKQFDLGVVLVGAFGFQILNYQRMFYENPTINYNMLESSQDLVYGKTKLNYSQTYVSYYIEDGDYVKINNLTFGYNMDVKKLKFVTSARIYASGSNLATFTSYKGLDPEIAGGNGLTAGNDSRDKYPTTRTFTLGINVNF
jgi:TonB-dependent starch-binding outer membrane protein SusC